MGYGTKLTADVNAGAVTPQVNEGGRIAVGDTIALGTGAPASDGATHIAGVEPGGGGAGKKAHRSGP